MKKQFVTVVLSIVGALLEACLSRRPKPRSGNTLAVIAIVISVLGQVFPAYTVYKDFIEYDPELRVGVRETILSNLIGFPGSEAIGASLKDDVLLLNDGNRPLYLDSVTGTFTKLPPNVKKAVSVSINLSEERSVLSLLLRNFTTPVVVDEGARHYAEGIILKPGEFREISWEALIAFDEGHEKLERNAVYAWILNLGYLDAKGSLRFKRMVGSIITFRGKDVKHPSITDFTTSAGSRLQRILD